MVRPAARPSRALNVLDLDGVATSPPLPEVLDAMIPWLRERHANPASIHRRGAEASRALEEARVEVARLVGVAPERVVFTSGATESNNLALRGAARLARRAGRTALAVAAHEHPSLLHPARSLTRCGFELSEIPVGRDGLVGAEACAEGLGVIALSHAHAELGTLQPVRDIVDAARRAGILTVLDATLTAGRIPIDAAATRDPDLLSLSFHHFGGPMGVGALVVGRNLPVPPLIEGGAQENGARPGSPNLAGCIGAGVAARTARATLAQRSSRLTSIGRLLAAELHRETRLRLTGAGLEARLPGHVSLTLPGIDGEAMVAGLDRRGLLAATGSPCADRAGLPSAALLAAGYDAREARGAVVMCLPPTGSLMAEDVPRIAIGLREELDRLRAVSGRLVS